MRRTLTERLSVPGLRLGELRVGAKVALGFVVLVALMAVLAPWISQYDPLASGPPVQSPSAEHWFGTDRQGRDVFARIAHGSRYSLAIGLVATGLALAAAGILGSIAATTSKWISEPLMRALDIIMSFPGIALAAVFVSVLGRSLTVLVLTIAFLYTPQLTRVVRANILHQYGEDYVAASRATGSSTPRLIVKHVARNCLAPVLVFATVLVADAIVFEASLSFIQAGVAPPEPSWGNVIAAGRNLILSGYWWPTFFPGLMITLTVLCLNILSEGMTDAMASPQARVSSLNSAGSWALPNATTSKATTEAVPQHSEPSAITPTTQAVPLAERLSQLRAREVSRPDRPTYQPDAAVAALLSVQDLCISFPRHGDVQVIDHVNFTVRPAETMALVGESGCGKSITSLAIMGLLDQRARVSGRILLDGRDLLSMSPRERSRLLGTDMAMIYQDALSALNPAMTIRSQLRQLISRGGTRTAEDLLRIVDLDPRRTLPSYPHELSGGQRQRVLIAMALTRDPRLVIADEPTTALDVTVQTQVIELLNRLREELGFAMLFVSHDLALVADIAHRVTVMYAGQVVEEGPTSDLLCHPVHEYTQGLLGAVLSIESGTGRLHQIPGAVPSPQEFPVGDRFAPRSSNPRRNLGVLPIRRQIPGTEHYYAAHPDDPPVPTPGAAR